MVREMSRLRFGLKRDIRQLGGGDVELPWGNDAFACPTPRIQSAPSTSARLAWDKPRRRWAGSVVSGWYKFRVDRDRPPALIETEEEPNQSSGHGYL